MNLLMVLDFTASLFIRTLLAQPFTIPAASMMPTLEVGDYVVATKFPYGYSNYSLPLGHLFPDFTYSAKSPKRGDVVIFRFPPDHSVDYIKRVIGLPGDRVQVKDGITYLNDVALPREPAGTYDGTGEEGERYAGMPLFREHLPDGTSYLVMEMGNSDGDDTPVFSVPLGHYFVMGDNRDNSADSRFTVGYVPAANIFAKASVAITWPNGKFTMRPIE